MIKEEIRLYASHHQFYIQDSEPLGTSDDPEFWTDQACDDRLAVAEGLLGIGTGSYDLVVVRVQQHSSEPSLDLSDWDHVTEASLAVRTPFVLVLGCLAPSGLFFRVLPGHDRARCCQANLATSVESTGEAGDWYLVQFWPAPYSGPRVLKRWV